MSFFNKIQSADAGKKKRWMVATTLVVMIFVVFAWLAYFNNLVTDAGRVKTEPTKNSGFSFLGTVSNGAAAVMDNVKALLSSPKEYTITPTE